MSHVKTWRERLPTVGVPSLAKEQEINELRLVVAAYEDQQFVHRTLVRKLDIALNGEHGAAKQASLCDIVAQVEGEPQVVVCPKCYAAHAKLQWSDYVTISDIPEVHEAIVAFVDSSSEDNAAGLIAAVIKQFINSGDWHD